MPLPSNIQAVCCREFRPNGICAVEREGLVLAEKVVRRGMGAFDGGLLNGIDHTERPAPSRLPACVEICELTTGGVRYFLGKYLGRAVDRVKRFRKAGSQAPADLPAPVRSQVRQSLRPPPPLSRSSKMNDVALLSPVVADRDVPSCCAILRALQESVAAATGCVFRVSTRRRRSFRRSTTTRSPCCHEQPGRCQRLRCCETCRADCRPP